MLPADLSPAFFAPGTVYMATGHGGYVGLVRVEDGQLDIGGGIFDAAFVKSAGGLDQRRPEAILREVGWPMPRRFRGSVFEGHACTDAWHAWRQVGFPVGHRFFVVGDAAGLR